MIELFQEQIPLFPSMRALIGRIVESTSQRFNQLILCPLQVSPTWLVETVLAELHGRSFQIEELDARRLDDLSDLAKSISRYFGIECSSSHRGYLDSLLEHLDGLDVVNVVGVEDLSADRRRKWLQLFVQWSRAIHAALDRGINPATVLCATRINALELDQIEPEHRLRVGWWWSLPSGLEMRLLCRAADQDGADDVAIRWREYLASSLASGDPEFLADVWPMLTQSKQDLFRAVRCYATRREWTVDLIKNWLSEADALGLSSGSVEFSSIQGAPLEPPARLRRLWGDGLVYYTPEYGCELHASALAVVGASATLDQRLWRAQASLILPWLDSVRHRICRHMAMKFGDDWPISHWKPESEEEVRQLSSSHLACQWGYLHHLLSNCMHFRSQRRISRLAGYGRRLRNELAHNRTVELTDLRLFAQEYRQQF